MFSLNQHSNRPISDEFVAGTDSQTHSRGCLTAGTRGHAAVFLCIVLLGATLSLDSSAHRQHFSWSDISYDHSANQIEIVHRVHAHDAIQLLELHEKNAIDLTTTDNQAKFALYIEDHFRIEIDDGSPSIELIGVELEGNYVFVYQQSSWRTLPNKLSVHSTIFQNLFADQLNVVNLHVAGQVIQSVEFRNQSTQKYFQPLFDTSLGDADAHSH